jgi:hypothetical protein
MTPKEVKAKHPGCQVKKTKSKSNGYELLIGYYGTYQIANVDLYSDVHLYLNDKYLGHWDNMYKPGKPYLAVWNKGTTKFTYVHLNLKMDDKHYDEKKYQNFTDVVNSGDWIEVDRQFDYNDQTVQFFSNYVTEFARNWDKRSHKWRGLYEMCERGYYPRPGASCAQYASFSDERGWYGNNQGIWHHKKGLLIPLLPIYIERKGGQVVLSITTGGGYTWNSERPKVVLDDKDVKAGNFDAGSHEHAFIEAVFKER